MREELPTVSSRRGLSPGASGPRPNDSGEPEAGTEAHVTTPTLTLSDDDDGTFVATWNDSASRPSTRLLRDLRELAALVHSTQPARIVVDLRLPMVVATRLLRYLKTSCPNAKMIVPMSRRLFSVSIEESAIRYLPCDDDAFSGV